MDLTTAVVVVLVLVVVVAGVCAVMMRAVSSLRADVDRLSAELERVRRDAEARVAEARRSADERVEVARREPAADESVAVIHHLDRAESDDAPEQVRTSRVVSASLGEPIIKAASLAAGVRHALDDEGRIRIRAAAKKELKRQRKVRKKARRRPTPTSEQRATTTQSPWTGGTTR